MIIYCYIDTAKYVQYACQQCCMHMCMCEAWHGEIDHPCIEKHNCLHAIYRFLKYVASLILYTQFSLQLNYARVENSL